HSLAQRWRHTVDDLERYALADPSSTYAENRPFWDTLLAVCVYLHSERAPLLPQDIWDALLAQLAAPLPLRNAGPKSDGPFKHFENSKTFDDLFLEQFKYLREKHGADKASVTGPLGQIPRATNGEVVALAEYWSLQLANVKEIMGHDAIVSEWKATLADVEKL